MHDMANAAAASGLAVLVLVLIVTLLSVTFATRGAMATNRPIIEVLHYVGATDSFVASQFQRHFLVLGLKGGAIGGGLAIVLFGAIQGMNVWLNGTAAGDEAMALFGSFTSALPAIWRSWGNRSDGFGDGAGVAHHRKPYIEEHRLSHGRHHARSLSRRQRNLAL